MDPDLTHRNDRVLGQGPRPPMPPAQALPPAAATNLPLHSKPSIPASQHRTAPRAPPPGAIEALWPWLRRPPPQPRSHPARYPGTHNLITQRGGDQDMHREAPAGTVATATTRYDGEPPQGNATRLKRARASTPPVDDDGRARERRTSLPVPGPRAPTPADATALPMDTMPCAPASPPPTDRKSPRHALCPPSPCPGPRYASPSDHCAPPAPPTMPTRQPTAHPWSPSANRARAPVALARGRHLRQSWQRGLPRWDPSLGPTGRLLQRTRSLKASALRPPPGLTAIIPTPSCRQCRGRPRAALWLPALPWRVAPSSMRMTPSGAPPNADYGSPGAIADAHRSGGAAAAPKPGEAAPAPADAQRATAHADPTRARPEAGFVVRVHGESASATVILPHPEQHDLLQVRWNTSMRQTSTISLTDVASMAPPRPKRLRASATANHADPTADDRTALTVNNRPAPTNTSQADHTADALTSPTADTETAPATCGQVDPAAQGRRDPAAGDHANPTAGGCTDSTTDHHTDPGAHDTQSICAKAAHGNPSSVAGDRNSGSAADAPDSSDTVPASADAPRATARADPTGTGGDSRGGGSDVFVRPERVRGNHSSGHLWPEVVDSVPSAEPSTQQNLHRARESNRQ